MKSKMYIKGRMNSTMKADKPRLESRLCNQFTLTSKISSLTSISLWINEITMSQRLKKKSYKPQFGIRQLANKRLLVQILFDVQYLKAMIIF